MPFFAGGLLFEPIALAQEPFDTSVATAESKRAWTKVKGTASFVRLQKLANMWIDYVRYSAPGRRPTNGSGDNDGFIDFDVGFQ